MAVGVLLLALLGVWTTPGVVVGEFMEPVEQRFAMEPQDQNAVVNSRVTLPCRVIGKSGTLQWTKDDFGLGPHRNLSGFDRYIMVGSDEEGDFSLQIDPVQLEDDARYQCQVSPGPHNEPGVRSRFATLTVLVPPEPPRIVQGNMMQTTEDREIELECVSVGGKPPSEITWIDGAGNVLRDKIETIVEILPDNRRSTTKSILKLTPKKQHHNTTFTCQAANKADRMEQTAKLRLEVKYAPNVTVSIVDGASLSKHIPEGSTIRLFCHADANPSDIKYRWFVDGHAVPGETTNMLVLSNVTRKHHDSIVKCQVENSVGKSEGSETLDVTYGPKFRQRPTSVQADLGSTAFLTCDVDGNPSPEITWIHENTDRVVGNSPNLTLEVDSEHAGRYYCKASVPGYQEIGAEVSVHVKGPPKILSPRTQWGHLGENVRIECVAASIPRPDRITWSFNGLEITSHDHDYNILEDRVPEGIKSTLVVLDAQQQDYGLYNCSFSNSYGTDQIQIHLRPQKTWPLIFILMGVCGAVIIIITITMIIILCQRRVKKPPVDTLDTEKQCRESDRSSNISDLKLEMRTGSSVSRPGSETGSERGVGGVPLAGPVHLPLTLNGGDHLYRCSTEYPEPTFPPKSLSKDGQNNNGYVPYVDYSRDYTPPLTLSMLPSAVDGHIPGIPASSPLSGVDPRYSAAYGNPYLRSSSASLLPPHTSPAPSASPSTASTGPLGPPVIPPGPPNGPPPPPPYSAIRNGAAPQVARLPNSPTSQYIVPNSQMATIKRGTLATHV